MNYQQQQKNKTKYILQENQWKKINDKASYSTALPLTE